MDIIEVPANTLVRCYNCGFEYEIKYTDILNREEGTRICHDCLEGDL